MPPECENCGKPIDESPMYLRQGGFGDEDDSLMVCESCYRNLNGE